MLQSAGIEHLKNWFSSGLSTVEEPGGVIDRAPIEVDVRALSQVERRILRGFGVRFGAFSLFLPRLLDRDALDFTAAFAALWAPHWRPAAGVVAALPEPAPPATALAALGLRAVQGLAAPVAGLEQLTRRCARRAAPAPSDPRRRGHL